MRFRFDAIVLFSKLLREVGLSDMFYRDNKQFWMCSSSFIHTHIHFLFCAVINSHYYSSGSRL